jgi:hypothetical protein
MPAQRKHRSHGAFKTRLRRIASRETIHQTLCDRNFRSESILRAAGLQIENAEGGNCESDTREQSSGEDWLFREKRRIKRGHAIALQTDSVENKTRPPRH